MILHLMHDEKVISRAIEYFENALPNENVYILINPYCGYNNKYVKTVSPHIHQAVYNSRKFWRAVGNPADYKYILLHAMSTQKARFVNKIGNHPGIGWVIWGGDLYNFLLKKKGYKLYEDIEKTRFFKGESCIGHLIREIKDVIIKYWFLKAIKKMSFVCASPGDYNMMISYYPSFKHLKCNSDLFYYPVDDIVGDLASDDCTGNHIIVGNSASKTNNHTTVFRLLSSLDLGGREVIVPISYGDNAENIKQDGQKYIKDNFRPLETFLPLNDYNKVLKSASTFIYANYRQEAMGNILVALYLGGTVFLDERNPLLESLRSEGFALFTISELSERINYRLSKNEKDNNIRLLREKYSKKRLLEVIKKNFG